MPENVSLHGSSLHQDNAKMLHIRRRDTTGFTNERYVATWSYQFQTRQTKVEATRMQVLNQSILKRITSFRWKNMRFLLTMNKSYIFQWFWYPLFLETWCSVICTGCIFQESAIQLSSWQSFFARFNDFLLQVSGNQVRRLIQYLF